MIKWISYHYSFISKYINKYQIGLEKSLRGGDFIFDCVHLLYYKFHKIHFKRGESYVDSSDQKKNK